MKIWSNGTNSKGSLDHLIGFSVLFTAAQSHFNVAGIIAKNELLMDEDSTLLSHQMMINKLQKKSLKDTSTGKVRENSSDLQEGDAVEYKSFGTHA